MNISLFVGMNTPGRFASGILAAKIKNPPPNERRKRRPLFVRFLSHDIQPWLSSSSVSLQGCRLFSHSETDSIFHYFQTSYLIQNIRRMYSPYQSPPQAKGLRHRQVFVESESEWTGDESESLQEYPPGAESEVPAVASLPTIEAESALESESAVEAYPSTAVAYESVSEGTGSTEEEFEVPRYTKSVRWTEEDDGQPRHYRRYERTARPLQRDLRDKKIKKFIHNVLKLIVFNIAVVLLLSLGFGFGSFLLRIGEKPANVIWTQDPTSYISDWLTVRNPPLQLPEVQEGIRAQMELMDLPGINASTSEIDFTFKRGQDIMYIISEAIQNRVPETERP